MIKKLIEFLIETHTHHLYLNSSASSGNFPQKTNLSIIPSNKLKEWKI
jgi:hypothetical protein